MFRPIPLCLIMLCALAWCAQASPVITEFTAENDGSLKDADGDPSDWIEIGNPDSTAVNLANWALTDDAGIPLKWRFPATTVAPGGILVVFASGKDRAV